MKKPKNSYQILVIDDEETLREATKDILELHDYKVFEAKNGLEGLQIAFEKKIDLIVLDLNMPRMDGYMFMEHFNKKWEVEHPRQEPPKILVITAVDFQKDLGLAQNLGASMFMSKPFQTHELLEAIEKLLTSIAS